MVATVVPHFPNGLEGSKIIKLKRIKGLVPSVNYIWISVQKHAIFNLKIKKMGSSPNPVEIR
ncbi:hypothetical protein M1N07_01065 [Thermodesulfovibrionales bacterium]|nr:hypothetical protein [Thermodesulfovibrionales bacterium]